MKDLIIGIDPPHGYAVWNVRKQDFERIDTTDFFGILDRLKKDSDRIIRVVVEAPHHNRPVFNRNIKNIRKNLKIAQNVGENKQAAKLIIGAAKTMGLEVIERRPTKYSGTKINSENFKKITGWQKRTSQHGRDAAMLVFGFLR